jgi:hypothetical protein
MTLTTLHASPAYVLRVDLNDTRLGHHLQFVSVVPTARQRREHVAFSTTLSRVELRAVHAAIDRALESSAS